MIRYLLLVSRQGKLRLSKWYVPFTTKEKQKIVKDVSQRVLARPQRLSNFIESGDGKIVYKRYASLYFIVFIENGDNELMALEIIHHFVECLDRFFSSVCELDLIFNFHKAYYILDELLIAGELQETSKKAVLRVCAAQDALMDDSKDKRKGKGRRRN